MFTPPRLQILDLTHQRFQGRQAFGKVQLCSGDLFCTSLNGSLRWQSALPPALEIGKFKVNVSLYPSGTLLVLSSKAGREGKGTRKNGFAQLRSAQKIPHPLDLIMGHMW